MSTRSPECWSNDPQARGLRVEVSGEHSIVLPYDQLAFAELESDGKERKLRIVFATHEVVIRGYSFRRIETAIQRLELSHLSGLPAKQRSLVSDGEPLILEIVLSETDGIEGSVTPGTGITPTRLA